VLVTFGRRQMVGMVWAINQKPGIDPNKIRDIDAVLDDLPPMPEDWLKLAEFAANYYQRQLGEVLLPNLPGPLRKPSAYTGKRSAGGPVHRADKRPGLNKKSLNTDYKVITPELNQKQSSILQDLEKHLGNTHF